MLVLVFLERIQKIVEERILFLTVEGARCQVLEAHMLIIEDVFVSSSAPVVVRQLLSPLSEHL